MKSKVFGFSAALIITMSLFAVACRHKAEIGKEYLDLISVVPTSGAVVKMAPGALTCEVGYINPTNRTLCLVVFPVVNGRIIPGTGSNVIRVAPFSAGKVKISCEFFGDSKEGYPDRFATNGLLLKMEDGDSFTPSRIIFQRIVAANFVWTK